MISQDKLTEDSFLYKYLADVCGFSLKKEKETFQWNSEVLEFFNTIKFLGGLKSYNFVRGPGFHGTGKGGQKEIQSLSDFNLCGPSRYCLRKSQPDFTCNSGIYSYLLKAFYDTASMPNIVVIPLFKSDMVYVIPCCMACDGTAVKPGLQYDDTHHCIVGLIEPIDINFVKENPEPNNDELKSKMVSEADVTFLTALDNSVSMPVGVHYLPKAFSGQDMEVVFTNSMVSVEICSNCLSECIRQENYILTKYLIDDVCKSHFDQCWILSETCEDCLRLGHTSHLPALRACFSCIQKGIKCTRVAVFAISTDCEEKNKQVMENFSVIKKCNALIEQAVMLQDCVHVGKSMKCS